MARPHNDASRRVEQIRKSLDSSFCLQTAKHLVFEKIERQLQWFNTLKTKDLHIRYEISHAISLLKAAHGKVFGAQDLQQLRGIEGAAAHVYFDGLKAAVPPELKFNSRNRRPPKDPFNALLSLTYTLLHAELSIALVAVGLDPYVGFYHQLNFGRESLASDLMEPMRPMADQFCQQLVRQRTLTADHFSTSDNGCLLGKAGRSIFYNEYEKHSETLRAEVTRLVDVILKYLVPCENTSSAMTSAALSD